MHKYTNALIDEPSPYLQQHAHNPVHWYAWGDEAFAKAKRENKPIFLSIGYSTCHWCHVMEHESFEDEEVAQAMNDVFVAIKVDREERPDIDQVYMQVAQMMNGSGGWPLNIIMTADKKPFYAGTYIAKYSRNQRVGMLDLSAKIKQLWAEDRDKLEQSAGQIQNMLIDRSGVQGKTRDLDTAALITKAEQDLQASFDKTYAGFGGAPKFPSPHKLLFLVRQSVMSGNQSNIAMVEQSLDAMRAGGLFDQIGFGFHRYSTDAKWLLPHFEKMLYDQAMLMMAYTEAYQATGHQRHARVVREIAEYVLRDMRDDTGGFYSAEDADSEGVEGKFYVWKKAEFQSIVAGKDAESIMQAFNIAEAGNFHDEATGQKTAENIPHLATWTESGLSASLEQARLALFAEREKRIHPFKDDKILTDWNGLMMAALAKASFALGEPKYLQAAKQCADFILQRMHNDEGQLLHRYRHGDAAIYAHLDDYAYLVWGLLELYEADFNAHYLQAAMTLNQQLQRDFKAPQGGFYLTANDAKELPIRPFDAWDGALPSGNAVAAENMLRLARISSDSKLEDAANQVFTGFSSLLVQAPTGFIHMLSAMDMAAGHGFEVVLAGDHDSAQAAVMLDALRTLLLPNSVLIWRDEVSIALLPLLQEQRPIDGKLTVYICKNFQCNQPLTDLKKVLQVLKKHD